MLIPKNLGADREPVLGGFLTYRVSWGGLRVLQRAAAVLIAAWGMGAADAAELTLLGEEAAAAVPVDNERRLRVEGIRGQIAVRAGESDEVQFHSATDLSGDTGAPVQLWGDDDTFTIRAKDGTASAPRYMLINVPPEFAVEIATSEATVNVAQLLGDVTIVGDGLDVTVRSVEASIVMELTGGQAYADNVAGELSLTGSKVKAEIVRSRGVISADMQGGSLSLRDIRGAVDIEIEGSELAAERVDGPFHLRATGGEARLRGLARGGVLELSGTEAFLAECSGMVGVETDATFRFVDSTATIRVDGFGASVVGEANEGAVEVMTYAGRVDLKKIAGPVGIQGDELQVELEGIEGAITVRTTGSSIAIGDSLNAITVENDFGDIAVTKSQDLVSVVSRDGNVTLSEMGGPVQVEADGVEVAVSWKTLNFKEESRIQNDRGSLAIVFPRSSGCSVDADSRYGRVETVIPGVQILGDGSRAVGLINRRSRPVVRMKSAGNIRLMWR